MPTHRCSPNIPSRASIPTACLLKKKEASLARYSLEDVYFDAKKKKLNSMHSVFVRHTSHELVDVPSYPAWSVVQKGDMSARSSVCLQPLPGPLQVSLVILPGTG